jgi:hypothetical protein
MHFAYAMIKYIFYIIWPASCPGRPQPSLSTCHIMHGWQQALKTDVTGLCNFSAAIFQLLYDIRPPSGWSAVKSGDRCHRSVTEALPNPLPGSSSDTSWLSRIAYICTFGVSSMGGVKLKYKVHTYQLYD